MTSLEADSFVGLSLASDTADRLGIARETITQIEVRALNTAGSDLGILVFALANRVKRLSDDLTTAIGSETHGR